MVNKNFCPMLFLFFILLNGLFTSCTLANEIFLSEEKRADMRMEQIISAIKNEDKKLLKSLFSKKALKEAKELDKEIDHFYNFIKGNINSWSRDGLSADESVRYGEKSLLIRFGMDVHTDKDDYRLFVMDYNIDTINPDNDGLYTLEIRRAANKSPWGFWQERLRPGIFVYE